MLCISFWFFIRSCTFYCKPNIWFSPAIVLKKWPFARVSCLYQNLQNKGSIKQANKLYWLRDSPGKGYNKIFKNVDTTDKCRPQKNGRQNLFSRPISSEPARKLLMCHIKALNTDSLVFSCTSRIQIKWLFLKVWKLRHIKFTTYACKLPFRKPSGFVSFDGNGCNCSNVGCIS